MRFIIIILLTLVLVSCKDGDKGNPNNPKTILLKNENKTINLSELVSEVNYISLETLPESLIGEIIKIKISDKKIYILNQAGANSSIKAFSYTGDYLGHIGEIGNGPKEIIRPRDFVLNNDIIYVWDTKGIHSFSKTGGYLKFMFEAHFVGRTIFFNNRYFFFLHELNPPGFLTKYDIKGNLKKVFIPIKYSLGAFEQSKIIELNGSYHIFSPLIDTIYTYSDNNLFQKYLIQCNNAKSLGKLFLENKELNPYELSKVINKTPSFSITQYIENQDFLYIIYSIDTKNNTLIINKKTGNYSYVKHFINDVDGGIYGNSRLITNENELVIPLNSYDILEHIKNNPNVVAQDSPLNTISKNLDLTSNPVLMICKLKSE